MIAQTGTKVTDILVCVAIIVFLVALKILIEEW